MKPVRAVVVVSDRSHGASALLLGTLLTFAAGTCHALSGLRWTGELGYNFRAERNEDSTDLNEHVPLVRLNAMGYLFKPWLATLEGGLQLQANRTRVDVGRSASDNVTGDLRLRLFPQSRFPFEAFAERNTTDTDSDLAGLSLDRVRYGVLQRYVTPAGTAFRMRYEHTDLTNVTETAAAENEERRDVADFFEASARRSLNHHDLSFSSNVNRIDTLDSPRRTSTSFTSLRHAYRPGATLTAEDMLTYNTSSRETETSSLDTNILQLSSFAFWRPDRDRPLRVNATLRAVSRESDLRLGPTNRSKRATGSLFANYDFDDRWRFTGGVGAAATDLETDRGTQSFQTIRATFNSRAKRLVGMDTSLFGRLDAGNDVDQERAVQRYGAQLGYRLSRDWMPGGGLFRAELRQSLAQERDTNMFSATRLLTEASLLWNKQTRNRTAVARLAINDSRTEAQGLDARGVEGEFQIANAQVSINHRFSSSAYLSANITLQAIREYRPRLEVVAAVGNGEWRPTATADVTYFTRSVFAIPRLSYRSTLRFISDAFVPLMEPELANGRNNKYWENRFDYLIGRVQLRLIGRLNRIRGTQRVLTLFQIRRMIGDT